MTQQRTLIGALVVIALAGGILPGQATAEIAVLDHQDQRALPPPPPPPPPPDFKFGMLAVEPFEMGEPVENAPYSAEIVNEVTQHLADGNRIERRTTGYVARDSQGRVRREHQLAAIGPVVPDDGARMVTINDPVARVFYSLDSMRKVAIRSRTAKSVVEFADGPKGSLIARAGVASGGGFDVQLQVHGGPESPDVQTEQLGSKEYEGVRAEGTRTVATLPAGAIGNVRPIEVVSERWYSPELGVLVFSRRSDPRFGETIYRLTNITRTEPDASLFQVPADYKREDLKPLPFGPPLHQQ